MTEKQLSVAVPVPLYRTFSYRVPGAAAADDKGMRGRRVRVSFGRRELTGVVVAQTRSNETGRELKPVIEVLDGSPLLDAELMGLAEWAAAYYQHPLGEVLQAALPGSLRHRGRAELDAVTVVRLTDAGREALATLPSRNRAQRDLLQRITATPLPREALRDRAAALRKARQSGWVEEARLEPQATPIPLGEAPTLTEDQQHALAGLRETGKGFSVCLLAGVTGSGKTELYLQRAAEVLARGQQVLVLAPEIGLTPQLGERFAQRFGAGVSLYHSAMADGERTQTWLRARAGLAPVVVGTRSAAWLPFRDLGLVIVDEEHDASYKQQDGFRYSARDLLAVRARRLGIPLILGSATPTLESLHNAARGRYRLVRLERRVHKSQPPKIKLLDVRTRPLDHGISPPLFDAISRHLDAGGQALLFINRRGYAPVLLCHDCGWRVPCGHCDAHPVLHRGRQRLICHHCGTQRAVPSRCESCDSAALVPAGQGTERVETGLRQAFPQHRVERMDSDRLARRGELERLLNDIRTGEVRLLVGTQLLAKGHDFAGLSLVGVLDIDGALFGSDFRALERVAQMVTQVAGRAGRTGQPGEVILQSHEPRHPMLQQLVREGYFAFCEELLRQRRDAGLPPFRHLALLRAESPAQASAMRFLTEARSRFPAGTSIEVLGPVPSPMEKRAGRYRAQLLLRCGSRSALQSAMSAWVPPLGELASARRVRWSVDVDPMDLS